MTPQTHPIHNALISVFSKDGLEPIVFKLHQLGVKIFSTGGTYDFINKLQIPVNSVEDLTGYPSILGGRVKTLHPKVFGGILSRREKQEDTQTLAEYSIPEIDLVLVDLYPFEKTLISGATHEEIVEKIDIGGISLIRAASKNYTDVLVIPSQKDYTFLMALLERYGASSSLTDRKEMAGRAFEISSHYDKLIGNYLMNKIENITTEKTENGADEPVGFLKNYTQKLAPARGLRYGENPHQQGTFYGDIEKLFSQLNGKELSYNNLVDIDAALGLLHELGDKHSCVIVKHTNACGVAQGNNMLTAYLTALSCDPVSAFGGIIACNKMIDHATAIELNKLFFEILIAPGYNIDAFNLLKVKKNRILLDLKHFPWNKFEFRTILNGVLEQEKDLSIETSGQLRSVTVLSPTPEQITGLLIANKICKHSKSNTIVLANSQRLLASGIGQTSRVDALQQAIAKAKHFNIDLAGSVMASDAFFPFPDCVEIAHHAGIKAIIQPGGSIKDQESIDVCNKNGIAMTFTGVRHFKH
ncbi:MAG: bifunctional phosphoribosylaminoimidazolecarboxamide formyltransferase/IMP cyclohydrolase [Bacteroidetes bacterium RIFCSPLOWO2_02_FULL_36_8]|nr:MAG: bifunctional phosphoribosylaminoimidazolecarboxamide formyltransferase/IMP cyclohydrolase [Bacteroidetes bacterium RIFCSPLOWO2_02_FULL_36_8]OFY69420.1 MAG: bifunctional phosphoribosylaminoimidazolecarboxamide formyltransferase/IMP cyclohydrolase [Bacteroidetes bacterium RIFCSPLOWO2_12_FULL_37_12]